jgi:3-oxoacyl-[acyl-carrier protein] reductase
MPNERDEIVSRLSRSIAGRVAIVTGAASGMGRATAALFAREGAKVAALDIEQRGLSSLVDEFAHASGSGGTIVPFVCDVAVEDAINTTVAEVRATLGPIDILVNNAGTTAAAPYDDGAFGRAWEKAMTINLTAPMRFARACLDDLRRNGDGRIVNIASTEGLGATIRTGPYTASKHGVVGLTRSLAVELGRSGVTANAICPGPIRTGMTAQIPEESKTTFAKRRVPVGRYGEPEEVAHIILSLVLPASSYLNGTIIPVDGGMTANNR